MISNQEIIYQPEKEAHTHGVVVLVVNEKAGILYGRQQLDNGRGQSGESSLIGETREPGEAKKQTLLRGLGEELGVKNLDRVYIPDDLRKAWLGSVSFLPGVNAQVFCLRWQGEADQAPVKTNGDLQDPINDFVPEGWTDFDGLQALNLRQGMRNIVDQLITNPLVMQRIEQISQGEF